MRPGGGGRRSHCARISLDNGLTWLPERYRPIFGFGYPGNLVLEDDAIVTERGVEWLYPVNQKVLLIR